MTTEENSARTPPTAEPPPLPPDRPRGNLILRHWRGQLSLGWAFWGIYFLGNIVVGAAIFAIMLAINADRAYDPLVTFATIALVWALVIPVAVWQIAGTWRAASQHGRERRRLGRHRAWAVAAKVMVVLGLFNAATQFVRSGVPQLAETYRMAFQGDPSIAPFFLRSMRGGAEIEIAGGFKFGLTRTVEAALEASPQVRVVHLQSLGGRVGEADKLFKLIRERGLVTYVSSYCMSACTLAFAGGRERWIDASARLGFHGPGFPGLNELGLAGARSQWRRQYMEAGLPAAFVDRALMVPHNDIWFPTQQELRANRVITHVAAGSEFAASGMGMDPPRQVFVDDLVRHLPVMTAIRDRMPKDFEAIVLAYEDGYRRHRSRAELAELIRGMLFPVVARAKPLADDAVLVESTRLIVAQYQALGRVDARLCHDYAVGIGEAARAITALPPELLQREMDLSRAIIETAAPRPPAPPKALDRIIKKVRVSLGKRFPPATTGLLDNPPAPPARQADYCAVATGFFEEILVLPPAEAAIVLRAIFGGT